MEGIVRNGICRRAIMERTIMVNKPGKSWCDKMIRVNQNRSCKQPVCLHGDCVGGGADIKFLSTRLNYKCKIQVKLPIDSFYSHRSASISQRCSFSTDRQRRVKCVYCFHLRRQAGKVRKRGRKASRRGRRGRSQANANPAVFLFCTSCWNSQTPVHSSAAFPFNLFISTSWFKGKAYRRK